MISIIGGSGFIGSRLCKRLEEARIEFIIIDKNVSLFFPEKTKIVDIRDLSNLKKQLKGVNCVINLAAEHRDDVMPKSLYDEVNVQGAKNVVEACEELGILRIIFTSSVAVYGFAKKETDEEGRINYFNDYGRTKWAAEEIYRKWFNNDLSNKSLCIIRPTVVFGERNRGNVYNLLQQIATGMFPMVGNGKNKKSMAYVENVAAFLEFCLDYDKGYHVFNYIDKPDFTMNELVIHVKTILGKKANTGIHWPYFLGMLGGYIFDGIATITRKRLPISSIRIKKFCADTIFESKDIQKTGYCAPISIEQGIEKTINYEFIEKRKNIDTVFYTE